MWFTVTVVGYILTQCSALGGKMQKTGRPIDGLPDFEDMTYQHLSPEAFFSMKDNLPPGMPTGPPMGPIRPGMPMRPGARPRGPGAGPMRPGAGPMRPGARPIRPGAAGPMGPGGQPMATGLGPKRPGMGPMKPGWRPGKPIRPVKPNIIEAPRTDYQMKGYEHFDLAILDDMARQRNYKENYAEEVKYSKAGDELIIYNLCFALSYIWRRGRESIRKYFHLRDIYHNHLPFEVGYITHVIMSKYQTMLELYQYSASLAKIRKNTITRLHLTHFQKTMVEDGLVIQHLSNMLHEVKNKYAFRPYDPGNKFDIPPDSYYNSNTIEEPSTQDPELHTRQGPNMDKAYYAQKIEESHKVIDETMTKRKKKLQAAREYYKKHGHMPTTARVAQQPMRLWSPNLDYGWSGEEDW